jgi:hypothetical protein
MNLKKILIGVIVIYGIISSWMIATPYFNNAMLSNDLDTIARTLSVEGNIKKATNQVREAVRLNEIPATDENFTIIRDEKTKQVLIQVRYTVVVKTPFELYTHTWNFSPRAEKGVVKIPRPGG